MNKSLVKGFKNKKINKKNAPNIDLQRNQCKTEITTQSHKTNYKQGQW